MTQPASAPAPVGGLLGDRYQLGHALPHVGDAPSIVWRAEDTVLARPVAVRVLVDAADASAAERTTARERFVTAAVQGGRATHPSVAAVLDADIQRRAGSRPAQAYSVVRWVDGVPLGQLLVGEPLAPQRATALLIAACRGVTSLHEAGIPHGRLHPGNLLVGSDDAVTVTDAVLASVLHGDPVPEAEGVDPVWADTIALGWVLHAALTGYWAGPRSWAPRLPRAPLDDSGHVAGPRRVRGGMSKELDALVLRVIEPTRRPGDPAIRTPAALAAALNAALVPLQARPEKDRARDGAPAARWWHGRRARWALRLGALVLLGVVGWVAGYQIGKVPDPPGSKKVVTPTVALTSPSPDAPAAITPTSVTDFDPLGDKAEDHAKVPLATDGDPSTGWVTELYTASPHLNNKGGVGLLVDLGSVQKVASATLSLGGGATDVELRAAPASATTAPPDPSGYSIIASAPGAQGDDVELKPAKATSSRFFLVWLTSLPPVSGGYQGEIDEMTFTPAAA